MRARGILAASALVLASCGTAPTTRLEYTADATDVVINIRCQLREASERVAFLREGYGWSALAVLNLTMVNNASIGGGPELSTPLGRKALGLGAGIGYGGRASSTVNFGFAQDLTDPGAIPCDDTQGDTHRPRLQGDLKIVEWLLSFEKTMTAAQIRTPAMSHEISFSVTRSASGEASLIAIPVGGSLLGVGGELSGSMTDEHTLILSYTRNPPPEKKGGGGGGGGGGGSHVSPPNDNRLEDLIILDLLRDKNRVRIPQ